MTAERLVVRLDSPLPESLPEASATALFCMGTACEGDQPVAGVELQAGGAWAGLDAVAMPRSDMPVVRSAFWGIVPVAAPSHPGELELRARVRLRDGELAERTIGTLPISTRETAEHGAPAPASEEEPLIAVCLASFDPDPQLLRRQLDSLRAQTDTGWRCVISDDCSSLERFEQLRALVAGDERFVVSRSERRIGFYRNFERALRLAPPQAELIALCDQDDLWRPDKLAVLRRSLGDAMLVYSDQRLVDARGRILRETLWRGRANNTSNLASMLIANTVTGAAALFRREVAERALPFPDSPGIEFHDHWIALVALASGELRYVDRPLYDYVQHEAAILGKVTGAPTRSGRRLGRRREWRAAYFFGYVPGKVRAQALLVRCGDRLTVSKRRALERYVVSDSSPRAFAWLALRPLRALGGRTETLAGEWELVRGIVWFRIATWLARRRWLPQPLLLDARLPDASLFKYRRLQRWRARV